MEESAKPRRAIGIVRVSNVGDRDDDFGSPRTQEQRIRDACQARGLELIAVHEELNVSGGKPLDKRPGLRAAVEAIEAGEGEVIVAGYFDRLVRSLRVQEEVVGRVERAGGSVLAVDFGNVSNGTAAEWLSASMIGMMSEYYRRSMGERTQEAKARAVAAGIPPWPGANPGYVRDERKRFVPDPKLAPVVAEAFAMRDAGRSVEEVRVFLAEHGVERTYGGVQVMLRSRVYIGEIHVRGLAPNLSAHEPIVEREVFERVQRMRSTRGRRAKSERLLARQGVLRCATCGRRMVIGSSTRSRGPLYSCPRSSRCGRRAAISADKVEAIVIDAVRADLANDEARASAEAQRRELAEELEHEQQVLDALIAILDPLEPAAKRRLDEQTAKRDAARERVEQLGGTRMTKVISGVAAFDRGTLDERRAMIRDTVIAAYVKPGRGGDRVDVQLFSEQATGDRVERAL